MPTGINFDLRLWADGRGEAAERSAAKQRRRQPAARAIVDKLPRAAGSASDGNTGTAPSSGSSTSRGPLPFVLTRSVTVWIAPPIRLRWIFRDAAQGPIGGIPIDRLRRVELHLVAQERVSAFNDRLLAEAHRSQAAGKPDQSLVPAPNRDQRRLAAAQRRPLAGRLRPRTSSRSQRGACANARSHGPAIHSYARPLMCGDGGSTIYPRSPRTSSPGAMPALVGTWSAAANNRCHPPPPVREQTVGGRGPWRSCSARRVRSPEWRGSMSRAQHATPHNSAIPRGPRRSAHSPSIPSAEGTMLRRQPRLLGCLPAQSTPPHLQRPSTIGRIGKIGQPQPA